jgi:tyrosyl-tRNA synthetase
MGGDDQWGNILAGVDLIRRIEAAQVEGITFPLLTTAAGEKMGKTAKGSVWLDATRTAPYDYYQYWINCDDRDVAKFLAFFTLLPMEEINAVASLEGAELNLTKAVLAYEATKITHGENEAKKAIAASASAFGKRVMPGEMLPSSTIPRGDATQESYGIPSTAIPGKRLEEGIWVVALFVETGLVKSNGEARRLIQQGGGYINENRVINVDETVTLNHLKDGELLLRAGKKRYHRVTVT